MTREIGPVLDEMLLTIGVIEAALVDRTREDFGNDAILRLLTRRGTARSRSYPKPAGTFPMSCCNGLQTFRGDPSAEWETSFAMSIIASRTT